MSNPVDTLFSFIKTSVSHIHHGMGADSLSDEVKAKINDLFGSFKAILDDLVQLKETVEKLSKDVESLKAASGRKSSSKES